MRLKQCTCCKKELTEKDVLFHGITKANNKEIAWISCIGCKSTVVLTGASITLQIRQTLPCLTITKWV